MNEHDCMQQLLYREYELQVLQEIGAAVTSNLRLSELLKLVADKFFGANNSSPKNAKPSGNDK